MQETRQECVGLKRCYTGVVLRIIDRGLNQSLSVQRGLVRMD